MSGGLRRRGVAGPAWRDLAAGLRKAEAAVKSELDYTIALLEKPLYNPNGDNSADTPTSLLDSIDDDDVNRAAAAAETD